MQRSRWGWALLALTIAGGTADAGGLCHRLDLDRVNRCINGRVIDHTNNHGADRRIWSAALCQRRDLYVYVPPCFDPCCRYPVIVYLHGFMQDEHSLLDNVVEEMDRAITVGQLPPLIIAAPDGSITGRASYFSAGSFFINSKSGNFEDYLIQNVWTFVNENYPIRPEKEAHVLAGVSMGGFAAYNLGIKHHDTFKVVVGIFPPLNLRWLDCHGRYRADFDPCCWGWRTQVNRGHEVIGRFYGGLVTIRLKKVIDPLFGRGPEALAAVIRENPIEMLDAYGVQEGNVDMYVAYAGRDEYYIEAQVESFLYVAHEKGLSIGVGYEPNGRHNIKLPGSSFRAFSIGWGRSWLRLRPRTDEIGIHFHGIFW